MVENLHTIKGTVFSKEVKSGASKKSGEPDWEMCIVKIEADVLIKGKTISTVCEYLFDWNVSFSEFSIGDPIVADFYIINKKIKKKDGSGIWEKEEKRIVFAKFGDKNSSYDNHKGKIKVDAMSNIDTIADPPKHVEEREKVFVPPSPADDDDDNDPLPF